MPATSIYTVLSRNIKVCNVRKFFEDGKSLLASKQTNIISAATIIMVMVMASRILGLVRNRVFVHYFSPEDLGTFFAAFSLPDIIFDILTMGVMASAFIPVFTKYLNGRDKKSAWYVSAITLNILLLFFAVFSSIIFIFAHPIYVQVFKNFAPDQINLIVTFTRLFLISQMFFAASYLLTAILETHQRFIISSVAPLFYNLGIILMTILFAGKMGLYAPVAGVVVGAALHFFIQLPFAIKLGFRPIFSLNFRDPGVREIGRLALPRLIELSFLQVKRFADVIIAGSFGTSGITYFRFGDALTSLPVGLFALSIAKASLPRLSQLAVKGDMAEFKSTFANSFKEILFFVVPISIFVAVLRLPLVRLIYGGSQFDWQSTILTGYVVSAFSLGIFAYSLGLLATRAFYALQDTRTPVTVAILTIILNTVLGLSFLNIFHLPIWGLPLAYAIAGIFEIIVLMTMLSRRVGGFDGLNLEKSFGKIVIAAGTSGIIVFALLKLLDRSAVDKNLWFLGVLGLRLPTTFDKFLLDTHYTINVIILTFGAGVVGLILYLFLCYILQVEELRIVARAFKIVSYARLRLPFFTREENKPKETLNTPQGNNL
jgi:putative peptidoglycan lipid II flippase